MSAKASGKGWNENSAPAGRALGGFQDVLHPPGRQLDTEPRSFFEPRFGHDFSRVRVHTDSKAAESAQAVNALAYTVGQNIVFNHSQYRPGTAEGRRLLAHELAHTVQQGETMAAATHISNPEGLHEREADRAAWAVAIGQRPNLSRAPGGALQRQTPEQKKSAESQKVLPPPPPTTAPPASQATAAAAPTPDLSATKSMGPDKSTPGAGKAEDNEKPKPALDQSLVRTSTIGSDATADFQLQLTYRNFHVASPLLFGRHVDILHEPGAFVQWSFTPPAGIDPLAMGALKNKTLGAAISIFNYHLFERHAKDLLELSFDVAGGIQKGDQGKARVGQFGPTAQLHLPTLLPQLFGPGAETLLTVNFSGQATTPIGVKQPQTVWGKTLGVGVKVQF